MSGTFREAEAATPSLFSDSETLRLIYGELRRLAAQKMARFSRPLWSMKRGCGSARMRNRFGKTGVIFLRQRPKPCAAS